MPADWGTFTINMKKIFGTPNSIGITGIADAHATEYVNAVKSANIVLSSSKATIGISKSLVKDAYLSAFWMLLYKTTPILPNYKGDAPNPNQDQYRKVVEDIFRPVALVICAEWQKEIFTPAMVPSGYFSPTIGYTVFVPGDPDALTKDLAKAFFIAQTEINQEAAFNAFIKALISAYTSHLLKIGGIFTGLLPGSPPFPGPPLPFLGVA
jgi:hypothetical protein